MNDTNALRHGTEQENFWAGDFGTEYSARNGLTPERLASQTALWSRILRGCSAPPASVLELGANVGLNLRALRRLLPAAAFDGVEINAAAAAADLRAWGGAQVHETSLLDFRPEKTWDLVFTCAVLIHVPPERLADAYDRLAVAARYVLIAEYYNPVPLEVEYRGHRNRLFKRDFAGEFLDRHADFILRDYGFTYQRDPVFRGADLHWFLLERRAGGGKSPTGNK